MAGSQPIPRIVGRYACYGEIAAGGMAAVHYGRLIGPVGFSRVVAIKRMHTHFADDAEFVAMFLDEAKMAARIRHPNVVPMLDVVSSDGELLLVMDYVPGESLARLTGLCRARTLPLPLPVLSNIVCGVLHGLHAAHEATDERGAALQLVHRDVSPQNVLVGGDGVPRVIDFGVAKATARKGRTRQGEVKGKLAYMAPEQINGKPLDRRTDVYAVGVVLWEALTLERLFSGDNEWMVIDNILQRPVDPPSARVPGLAPQLDALVLRALRRDLSERFHSANEMALALEAIVPPASSNQMTQWVQSLAGDLLAARALAVAEVERDEDGLASASMDSHARGHAEALSQLFDAVAPGLYQRLCADPANSREAAEQVLEATLLQMHSARGKFAAGAQVRPWADAIASRVGAPVGHSAAKTRSGRLGAVPPQSKTEHPVGSPALADSSAAEAKTREHHAVPPGLKKRVVDAAQARPSPKRSTVTKQLAIYAGASLVVGLSIFVAKGGFRDWHETLPWWFILGGSVGWLVAAIVATWGALNRGNSMLGMSRVALIALATSTPLFMFVWMLAWGATCPATWPSRIGFKCLWMSLAVAVVPLFTLIRARRGTDPVHPEATGAALGAAAGAWAGVIVDLWCPIATASHVFIGHVLPMLILTVLGSLIGWREVGIRPPRPPAAVAATQ